MEVQSIAERRKVAVGRRRQPVGLRTVEFPAFGDGCHGPEIGPYPDELRLESTCDEGQIADWFDDNWWLETLRRWKDCVLTIHLLPTPDALLHPIVTHELEMVRRLQSPWRLIGHAYLSDIAHPLIVPRVAVSHYDEVRIIDRDRPVTDAFAPRPAKLTLAELMAQVHEIQSTEKLSSPLLTQAPVPRACTLPATANA